MKLSHFLLPTLLLLAACGPKNNDAAEADQMVAEASAALDRGDFQQASDILDSMQVKYPHEVTAGRQGLLLRPKIMERKTEQEIVELQATMQSFAFIADSLKPFFNSVPRSDDQLEPYMIHKDAPANWRERNTAVARVNPLNGEFYVTSSLAGRSVKHTAISLTGDGISVSSGSVPFDNESLLSRESVRFPAAKADTLGVFAVQMDGKPLTLNYLGGGKAPAVTLSAKEVHAMADTYRLSRALSFMAPAAARLDQLKAKLQVSRDQQARHNL